MGKMTAQGTRWESAIVGLARRAAFVADRYPKRGVLGEPDVWIESARVSPDSLLISAVFWKRLVKSGGRRRAPDGEPAVVVLDVSTFLDMLGALDSGRGFRVEVQAKATERLNVTRVLWALKQALVRLKGKTNVERG